MTHQVAKKYTTPWLDPFATGGHHRRQLKLVLQNLKAGDPVNGTSFNARAISRNANLKQGKFDVVDVRKLTGNFLPKLLDKADQVGIDHQMCVMGFSKPATIEALRAPVFCRL